MFEPRYFQASAFGKLVAQSEAYRRVIQVPMRNYYGETDEAIPAGLARLAMVYQQSLGKGNDTVEAISMGNTDHRGTYAMAVLKASSPTATPRTPQSPPALTTHPACRPGARCVPPCCACPRPARRRA